MRMKGVALLICVGASVLAGCGGEDNGLGATCGQVQPCGGDVVGNWNLAAYCQSSAASAAFANAFAIEAMGSVCPTETVRILDVGVSGAWLFGADATYSVSFEFSANLAVTIPASCLGASDCATVSANLQAEIAAGVRPGVVAASCAGSRDCVCQEVLSLPQSEVGTYATAGSIITFTAPDGTASTTDYCIQEQTAHFMRLSSGSAGQGIVDSDIVGVRR